MDVRVRPYVPVDGPALGRIFHRAVHEGASLRYTPQECHAWSPEAPATPKWENRLAEAETFVAETDEGPVGFMSLYPERSYLDLAYILPEAMGTGVAATLYAVLETRARSLGLTRLTTEASLLAEPFFRRQGWRLVQRQRVERLGVLLSNAVMEKRLDEAQA